MKDLNRFLFAFTIIALAVMTMLWWRDVAVAEKIVYRPRVVTVMDTTRAEVINAMWAEMAEELIDSLSAVSPDTIYKIVAAPIAPDTVALPAILPESPWREMIQRLIYQPPTLSFITALDSDTTGLRRLVYSDIPWGFMVYPDDRGRMLVQNIESPPPVIVRSGYNWGIGLAWPERIVPAMFASGHLGIGRIKFTGLINVSTVNMNLGLYLRWR